MCEHRIIIFADINLVCNTYDILNNIIHCLFNIIEFYLIVGTFFWDILSTYTVAVAMCIPISVMVVCYTRMIYALYKSSRSLGASNSANSDKLRLAQKNIFQTCLIMIVFFLVCWITYEVAVIMFVNFYSNFSNTHYIIGKLLIIFNSCINPYIYVFRYDDFKIQLRRITNSKEKKKCVPKSSTC